MPAVPHPALVPRLPSPGVRRLPPPLASRAPAVVRALRPTGAAVRALLELLTRTRDTVTQTALTPEARLANVAGAFATRNAEGGTRNRRTDEGSAFRVPSSAFERPLILVDDVFTTGATLAEAARALERAGAHTVSAVTFGRAVVPDFT